MDAGMVSRLDGIGIAVVADSLAGGAESPFCCWICFCDSEGDYVLG